MKKSKAVKELRAIMAQIDSLIPSLQDKPSKIADLIIEKSGIVRDVHALETADSESEQERRISELESETKIAAARNSELERENAELQRKANERLVEYQPDPKHAETATERDTLRNALQGILGFIASLPEDARAELAVRIYQSHPAIAETVCRSVKIDYGAVIRYTEASEPDLKRLQTARDSNGVIIRAVLTLKYPPPANKPDELIRDSRSVEEKLQEAKEYGRQAWR